MKKIVLAIFLATIFSLTISPALALEVDINYDNYVNTNTDLSDSPNSINIPVDNDVDYGDYVGLGDPTDYGSMTLGKPTIMDHFKTFGGVAAVAFLLILAITITIIVLNLLNIYHWGMTDKVVFDRIGVKKKKWYIILFIVPLIIGVVNIIPILGQIIAVIVSVYYIVMVFVYFFSIRKKAI